MATVTLSGTTPATVDFKRGASRFSLAQVSGDNAGTVTVEVRLAGQDGYNGLDSTADANKMDLTDTGQPVYALTQPVAAGGIRLTGAGLTSDVDIAVAEVD